MNQCKSLCAALFFVFGIGMETNAFGNPVVLSAASDFTIDAAEGNRAEAYVDKHHQALAVNAKKYKDMYASASTVFDGPDGIYDVTVVSLLETDGESCYKVFVDGYSLGYRMQNEATEKDYVPFKHTWNHAFIRKGDEIRVEFNSHTNGKVPERDATAYSRGRWTQLILVPVEDPAGVDQAAHFQESGGLVVMEVESTLSNLGEWIPKTDVSGYCGEGHLEFTGNSPGGGQPASPLVYRFTIEKEGTYQLAIRARKRLDGQPGDRCNDGFVRVVGEYDAVEGGAPMDVLVRNTKFFGGDANQWAWAQRLDASHKKYAPLYRFKSGETYTLVLSGRSMRWNIDRIVFYHAGLEGDALLASMDLPESPRR